MGTHDQRIENQVRAINAYIKLMRAANALTSRIHRHLGSVRLTVRQFGVLEALHPMGSELPAKEMNHG
jgi:MarR family transcriptional regulator, 2-MHQ and catechol-resistance regulon repressor